ncbi:MAG: family 43 glycosylhydrolase [Opitutaceae bacterium]|nr:family 43 glycosylhydrolase [Opitutaceae bacterium]
MTFPPARACFPRVFFSLVVFCAAMLSSAAAPGPAPAGPLAKTFINPLPLPDYPLGNWTQKPSPNMDRWLKGFRQDFRELADPSVIYHEGKWIMYPSVAMAYVSEDFVTWRHHPVQPAKIGDGYAPTVARHEGKFYMAGCFSELYVADDPLGPFKSLGPITTPDGGGAIDRVIFDPMLFSDGGVLYLYYHVKGQLVGTRLDPGNPARMAVPPKKLAAARPDQEWERYGEYNEDPRRSFMEGVWMFKHNGTYYLTFTGPGTANGTYAIGAYKGSSPLGGFVYQENNPVLRKTAGVVPGAGHGSIVRGPGGTLWAFVTSVVGNYHVFERRVGLFPVGIDDAGNLFAFPARDVPQHAPGVAAHPERGNEAGWLPVSVRTIAAASSCAPGRTADYAIDDSARTWWAPSDDDAAPSLTVDLKTTYDVAAVRILWAEPGLDHEKGVMPGPMRYRVLYQTSRNADWRTALDCSDNRTDLLIDYRPFETVRARRIKLEITGAPAGIRPGVLEFTAFGKAPPDA